MSILGAAIIPHPPLIIPTVDRGREQEVQSTSCTYFSHPRRSAACRSFGKNLPLGRSGGRKTDTVPAPPQVYRTSGRIWRQGRFPLRRSM